MQRIHLKPSEALRNFVIAAENMEVEILKSLDPGEVAAMNEATVDGRVIGRALRIEADSASQLPRVIYELIDIDGGRHVVQTHHTFAPPAKPS